MNSYCDLCLSEASCLITANKRLETWDAIKLSELDFTIKDGNKFVETLEQILIDGYIIKIHLYLTDHVFLCFYDIDTDCMCIIQSYQNKYSERVDMFNVSISEFLCDIFNLEFAETTLEHIYYFHIKRRNSLFSLHRGGKYITCEIYSV